MFSSCFLFLFLISVFLSLALHAKRPNIIQGKVLIFLLLQSTYSAIYFEKYALYLANFNHMFEVFQRSFFAFLL